MLIRYGYEITLTTQQPTALVCLLSVHEDRDPTSEFRRQSSPPQMCRYRPIAICSATGAGGSSRRRAI